MRKNIHPKYTKITATCSCGYIITTYSTLSNNINLEICSSCHPFYTNNKRVIDTKGRIDRFNKRFKKLF